MFYVINADTMYEYKRSATARGAKIAKAALVRKQDDRLKKNPYQTSINFIVVNADEYALLDVMVEVRNCLSGKVVKIRKSDVGSCCDPSTERYHSM